MSDPLGGIGGVKKRLQVSPGEQPASLGETTLTFDVNKKSPYIPDSALIYLKSVVTQRKDQGASADTCEKDTDGKLLLIF